MKNKKKIALGAAALAVVMVAAGTFAWFTTTDKVENIFGMDNFDVTITEDFDKPDVPLVPGTDVTKQVGVTNSGNVPVVVRVKLEETLALLEQDSEKGTDKLKVVYETNSAASEAQVPVLISQNMIDAYKRDGGYKDFVTTSYDNLTGITVLRKTSDGTSTTHQDSANTVYSYLAYVSKDSPTGSGNHHLVQVTPVIGNGSAAAPQSFEVKYAYNLKKPTEPDGSEYSVTATHGLNDTLLNKYYGSEFHNIEKGAVVLNFAENVQTDGQALVQNTAWYLADDGYFYYTKALKGESISEPLLKSVSIKETAGNALKGATYTLTPVMEAVQKEHGAVWEDLSYTFTVKNAAQGKVNENNQAGINQMICNIIMSDKGYYAGT